MKAKSETGTAAGKEGAAKASSSAASVEELAARLSPGGVGKIGPNDWDENEVQACLAMVRAAVRLKSDARLEAAIDAFGGLPPQGGIWASGKILDDAAKAPDAFGFERLLAEQQKQGLAGREKRRGQDEQEHLGEWLREGLFNSYYNYSSGSRSAVLDTREAASVGSNPKPVAACLAHDNPVALARILKDPQRRAALARVEPTPMAEPPDWSKMSKYSDSDALVSAARAADAGFEKSLLWQSIKMRAYRCAALLCALPEFNKPLLEGAGLGPLGDRRQWFERSPNQTFEEQGPAPFCFFEWAAAQCHEIDNASSHSERPSMKQGWLAMMEAMVDAADQKSRDHQQAGTGMGWPEMFFVRAAPHRWGSAVDRGNEFAQAETAQAMAMLDRFEAKGFAPQWGAMAEACKESRLLKDWMELKGSSAADGGAPMGRKAKRNAL